MWGAGGGRGPGGGNGRGPGGGNGQGPGGGNGQGPGGGSTSGDRLDDQDFAHLPSSRQRFAAFRQHWRDKALNNDQGKEDAVNSGEQASPRKPSKKSSPKRRQHLQRYKAWLLPFWKLIVAVMVLGLVVAGMDTLWPLLVGEMVNGIAGDERKIPLTADLPPEQLIMVMGISSLAIIIVSRLITLLRGLLSIRLSMQTAHRLRAQLFDRFIRLPLSELHDLKSGGVISRLSTDVDQTTSLVQQGIISPLSALIRLVVVVAVMVAIDWRITMISMGLLILMGLAYYAAMRKVRPIFRSMGKDRAGIDGRVGETFGGIRVVRAFARETFQELDYAVGHHTVIRKQVWARLRMNALHMFWEILMPLVSLLVVWIGGYSVLRGEISLGEIVAIQMLTFQILGPVMMIVQSMTETQRSLAAMDRVYEILDMDEEMPDRDGAQLAATTVDELCFHQISFSYQPNHEQPEKNKWALRNVNLTIPGGTTLALVGASGAGKTTTADLIARFHDPVEGVITLNGTDLRDLQLNSFRQLLGVVQQETFLFDGSIADNIRYGRREASEAEIIAAAKQANAWEFISELDEGLDSIIGERGVKLSGGQRQRLAIARAFLADPAILILDEATSNLDSASEQLIQQSIDQLLQGRTTIIIAHRLSTVRNADQIVVLNQGEVVEQGSHDELVGLNGRYADMVRQQRIET